MSDDGDRTCPLCAEEMDLTDQQLKPCKCGYEICVWCWHQINDMAEKEETEGRCPACRTPYDKERIVRMAANCERLVAEINAEKKQKSQKSKLKISAEARKHLSSVRVVQRNLVYIIGLPTNLCDESILERKEYFGQYGKIIKVSLSRSGSAPSQQTPSSNTFSVYVTYAREEEAIRCIQAVHNYVLEGKTLRACFGTTKYCHAWLRNMTCSNPDCLYLHDIGSQEDSFTKDEVISAYTRSRVPQVGPNNSQQRSGNVLPPPADDLSSSSTSLARNPIKSTSNIKGSSNNIGKSTVLPAAASWGLRSSNCRPPTANATCSQPPQAKQKLEMVGNLCLPSILTETTKYPSAWNDELVSVSKVLEIQTATTEKYPSSSIESAKQSTCHSVGDIIPKLPESKEALQCSDISRTIEPMSSSPETVTSNDRTSTSSRSSDVVLTSKLGERKMVRSDDRFRQLESDASKVAGERKMVHSDDRFRQLESDASKVVGERKMVHYDDRFRQLESQKPPTDKQTQTPFSDVSTVDISDVACTSLSSSNILHNLPFSGSEEKENLIHVNDDSAKQSTASPKGFDGQFNGQSSDTINDVTQRLYSSLSFASKDIHDRVEHLNMNQHHFSDSESITVELPLNNCTGPTPLDKYRRNELRVQSFDPLKEKPTSVINSKDDPCDNKVLSDILVHLSSSPYLSHSHSHGNSTVSTHGNKDALNKQTATVDKNIDRKLEIESSHLREKESALSNCHKDDGRISHSSRMVFKSPEMSFNEEKAKTLVQTDDFVSNNKYTTVDLKRESCIISDILSLDVDPWDDSNAVNSFARLIGETERQEKSLKLLNSLKTNNSNQSRFSFARQESQGNLVHPIQCDTYSQIFCSSSNDSYKDMPQNGISYNAFEAYNTVTNSNPVILSDKFASTSSSKSKISAPPGFSVPNKAPPPGFLTHDRLYQTHETTLSGNHVLGNRVDNHCHVQMDGSPGDVEFIDPAILAVGMGRMSVGTNNPNFGVGSTLPSPITPTDARLHLLKQHSLSSFQNFGFPDAMVDTFLPFGDAYVTSRLSVENHSSLPAIAQMPFQQLSSAQFLSQQRDGLNNLWSTGSNMGMSDPMRAERFGRNLYSTIEEQKLHFANGDIYNRDFRM